MRNDSRTDAAALPVESRIQVIPARKFIVHQREQPDFVPVICDGWAASHVAAPDGRKQIVSVLLPGDAASMNYFFEPCAGRTVEAISEVHCRKFARSDLQALLASKASLVASFGRALGEERERGDRLIADLSRRSAEARIARLFCSLIDRLRRIGRVRDNTIEFPMRQLQLADATGLTSVHVCKVLGRFRASGLIRMDDPWLTVTDEAGLQEIAG